MKAISSFLACIAILTCFTITSVAAVYKFNPASGTSAKNKVNWRSSCATPGSTFPGVSDTIQFDGSCSNANCVFDTTFNVAKINVKSNYSGTISVSGSITLTFGIGIFDGGTFNGGSVPLTFNVSLKIDGCSFSSTDGTLNSYGDFTFKSGSFSHNSGTVIFHRYTETTTTIGGTSNGSSTLTLFNAEFAASSQNSIFRIRNITLEVVNEMKLTGNYHLLLNTNSSSVIEVQGNIISSNTATVGGGDCLIIINGTGSQSLSDTHGTTGTGKLCNMKIDKSSGTLSLAGNIAIGGSTTWEYVDGTVNEGSARLICDYNNTLINNSGGEMKFAKLDMVGDGGTHTIDGKILVTDTFSTSNTGDCDINGDTLELQGNVVWDNTSSGSNGNVFFKFSGGADQIVSGQSTIQFDKIKLIKSDGNITLSTPVSITTDIEFVTGNLISDTINLVTIKHGATATGASENSFVSGAVKKIGSSSFVFPVGKDTVFNPIAITTSASSSTDAFRAEYFNDTQPHGFALDSLTYLSRCEYWNLKRLTGSSNVKVSLNWNAQSCDIHTLSTLRIGRWDGSKWNNTGTVTTTGNTTAGTIETNSNQSSFGDFIIAKMSPAVIADAGTDIGINLGNTATLGGAPTASGGISPYTYKWTPGYALNSSTVANPVTKPFTSQVYILEVTDLDFSYDLDTIVVNVDGFDLKSAERFPLLTNDSLIVDSPISVVGAVGAKIDTSGHITATDTIFINTSTSDLAIRHLDTAMQKIDALSASALSSPLEGQSLSDGVYRIATNATLDGILILSGTSSTYIVIDINGNLNLDDGSVIQLDGITWNQVFIRCVNLNITGSAVLSGIFLLSGSSIGNVSAGDFQILANGKIKGEFNSIHTIMNELPMEFIEESQRPIENFFGFNVSNITQSFGVGSDEWIEHVNEDKLPALHSRVLRFPGGADANWWRWQSGWIRGYNNPAYKDAVSLSGYKYEDEVPFPDYCLDGIPWDLNKSEPQPNTFEDFRETVISGGGFPIFDINMLSSDAGTEIGGLFHADCVDLPVKYVELGNEFALSGGEEATKLYPTATDYFVKANDYSRQIKSFFPDVKIAAVSTTRKGDDERRNNWNSDLQEYLNDLSGPPEFDALTFHLYPGILVSDEFDCDLDDEENDKKKLADQIFSSPFTYFNSLETTPLGKSEELAILNQMDENGYNLEGWITEYNQEEDQHNFHGRWAHGLFTATMALRALQNPFITKATCFELVHSANRAVIFGSSEDFATNGKTCPGTTYENSIPWNFGAAGVALRYVGMASQNALSARQLDFGDQVPIITSKSGDLFPALYGWVFSNVPDGETYSKQDSNWAVILNYNNEDLIVKTNSLFPSGGVYVQVSETEPDHGLTFVIDPAVDLKSQDFIELPEGTNSMITIPAYGLVFIRGGGTNKVSSPIVLLSKKGMCRNPLNSENPDHYITAYLSATNALDYVFSPSAGVTMFTTGSCTTAKIVVAGDVEYQIRAVNGSKESEPVTIELKGRKYPLVDPSVTGEPVCPESNITLDANPLLGSYLFNWYPTSTIDNYSENTFLDEETAIVNPVEDSYYHLNVTDGYCYCLNEEIFVNTLDSADAGEDIFICTDPEEDVFLGGQSIYNYSTGLLWTEVSPSPDIEDDISQPEFPTTLLTPGDYTYALTVSYEDCDLPADEVTVKVVSCCDGASENKVVFDPYEEDYGGEPYLTSSLLLNKFSNDVDLDDYYYPNLDVACSGDADEVNAIAGFTEDLVINGLFYIDQTIAFSECPNLIFGPQAKIIIEPNARLIIRESGLRGCANEMWKGIFLEGNLNETQGLDIQKCNVLDVTPVIADAEYGVFASKDSRLFIANSTFDKNFHHVWVENYRFALSQRIFGNTFEKSGSLLDIDGESPLDPMHGVYMKDVPQTEKLENNNFYNCHNGIYAEYSGFKTSGNTMTDVYNGIYSLDQQGEVHISDNDIEDCHYGVRIQKTNGFKTEITANEIITKDVRGSAGILVSATDETVDLMIGAENFENVIYSNTKHGIYLQGFTGGLIQHNNILLEAAATGGNLKYGIRGESINGTEIYSNTIDLASGDPVLANKRGISLSTTSGCILKCNSINNTEFGIQFQDVNDIGTVIEGNTLTNNNNGLVLGEDYIDLDSTIPDQGNDDLTPGNAFENNNNYDLFTINNSTSLNIEYTKKNDPNPPILSGETGGSGSEILILTAVGNPPFFGENGECEEEYISETNSDEDLFESIIDGGYAIPEENEDLFSFTLKMNLFERFRRDPILRNSRIIFSNFFDTIESNNIRQFALVDEYISKLSDTGSSKSDKYWIDTALAVNNSIDPDFSFEENQKVINDVYLNTVAKKIFSYSNYQWDYINEIAFKCPYLDGRSVYLARTLYNLRIDTMDFDDRDLCDLPPKLDSQSNKNESFYLYPNPSNDQFILLCNNADTENIIVKITDLTGHEMTQRMLGESDFISLFSTETLPAGLYLCSVIQEDKVIWIQKFVKVQ